MVFKRVGTLLFLVILLCSCTREQATEPETAVEAVREEATLSETDLPASDPEAYYRIPIKETPEYHSFIYRYERMRSEQLELLEASVTRYGLTVDMKNSQSLNSAGYALYERKDYAGAIQFFREAAYVDISNVYTHYNLACSLSLLRDSNGRIPGRR
jgi:tetratricopeptide (TPR) repeat protein